MGLDIHKIADVIIFVNLYVFVEIMRKRTCVNREHTRCANKAGGGVATAGAGAPPGAAARAARTRDLRREYLFHYTNYNILSGPQPLATNICNLITYYDYNLCLMKDFLKVKLEKRNDTYILNILFLHKC